MSKRRVVIMTLSMSSELRTGLCRLDPDNGTQWKFLGEAGVNALQKLIDGDPFGSLEGFAMGSGRISNDMIGITAVLREESFSNFWVKSARGKPNIRYFLKRDDRVIALTKELLALVRHVVYGDALHKQ